ncbi:MAG: hypothetical protein HFH13_04800 [Dorea sp.]|nr:hypothetical protein [Dorea sp.]
MRKYLTSMIMAVLALFLVLPFSVKAREQEAVYLEAEGESVKVRLTLPGADGAMLSSLKLTLNVASDSGQSLDASFQFDPALSGKAKVQEARYHAGNKTLNVYLAGNEALFAKGEDTITLGKVCASGGAYTVEVKEDSLTVAEGSKGRTVKFEKLPKPVLAGSTETGDNGGGDTKPPIDSGDGEKTPPASDAGGDGEQNVPPSGSGNGDEELTLPSGPENGEETPPVEEEQLQELVNTVKEYPEKTYTKKSYAALTEARKNAEGVQNNPNATKEDRDKALQSLQNAVGALEEKTLTSAEEKNGQSNIGQKEPYKSSVSAVLYVMIALFVLVIAGIIVYGIKYKKNMEI